MEAQQFLDTVDRSTFSLEPMGSVTTKPWGEEVLLTPAKHPYAMKIIRIKAGCRLSLQAHNVKVETWTLISGEAGLVIENNNGELTHVKLARDEGRTSVVGQRHRLVGVTDCEIVEASTPELGTTYRLEDDYQRPDETEEVRSQPNRGWAA